jgi:hypothetical protein
MRTSINGISKDCVGEDACHDNRVTVHDRWLFRRNSMLSISGIESTERLHGPIRRRIDRPALVHELPEGRWGDQRLKVNPGSERLGE